MVCRCREGCSRGRDEIARKTIKEIDSAGIFVDHKEESRVDNYFDETNFPNVPDELLYKCLKMMDFKPDFVLLDSGGHIGEIEFNYLIENLAGPCYIGLDDIYHIKHHKSFERMQRDNRFEIIVKSDEKFGFCIAKFTPVAISQNANKQQPVISFEDSKKVLIVRPDSIGDFVIFSGVLKNFREIFPKALISILLQEHIAELAENCPYIDKVIPFNRKEFTGKADYNQSFLEKLQNEQFDVAIYPVYSRDKVGDSITLSSGAGFKIASFGDETNIFPEEKINNDCLYDRLIPASVLPMLETRRNEELIRGLGVRGDVRCEPMVWLNESDRAFAEKILNELKQNPPIVICPFGQNEIRNWPEHKWIKLIDKYKEYPILICGNKGGFKDAERIIARTSHRNIHNLCGKTTLRQLAAVLEKARLCIGAESAGGHLAAAVNCPNVILIGGGHFGRFMPNSPTTTLVYLPMQCYNCNWLCQYRDWEIYCISQIQVETVDSAVRKVLGTSKEDMKNPIFAEQTISRDRQPAFDKSSAGRQTQDARRETQVTSHESQVDVNSQSAQVTSSYLVSAIVSTYNSEQFLRGCLEDLESQTIADSLEIIVVNSGSQQNEEEIVKEFQQKFSNIIYIKTEQREGVYAAWNRAVKIARGQFLTNANTDDRHRKDCFEIMAKTLLDNPDAGLVYGDQIITKTANDTFENHHGTEFARRPEFSPERLLFGCCVGSQPMWRRKLHDELGYFDETLNCAGDWDFWLRISQRQKFLHIPEFLGLYYHNERGIEHSRKIHSLYERYLVGKRYGNPYISVISLYQHKDDPLVSVIMPAFNAGKFIAEAIESVLISNYRNFELIVVDDGSSDNTKQIVDSFKEEKIRYFYKENGGPASARNLGIKNAKGSYIVFLDADDEIVPDFISRHLEEFSKDDEEEFVYCDDCLIDEGGRDACDKKA